MTLNTIPHRHCVWPSFPGPLTNGPWRWSDYRLALRFSAPALTIKAKPNLELALHRGLLNSGFQATQLRIEMPIAMDPAGRRWLYDLLVTTRLRFEPLGIVSNVGDCDTVADRLE